MIDKKCTYSIMVEEEGNKKPKEFTGTVRSGIHQKVTEKGTYSMIWVEDQETGELREVFANTIKMVK